MLRKLFTRAPQSRTVQLAGLFGAIWVALSQSPEIMALVGKNPQLVAILGGIQAAVTIWQRVRKGHEPILTDD